MGNAGLESRGLAVKQAQVSGGSKELTVRTGAGQAKQKILRSSLFSPNLTEAAASGKEERLDQLSTDHPGGSLCHW